MTGNLPCKMLVIGNPDRRHAVQGAQQRTHSAAMAKVI
jgi:hypothetical protein